jgi:glyoxylase-like metal-dependent hydrolase (beta-lactamase superfamily II)
MIQGLELSPGVWVLQNEDTGRNTGVVTGPDVNTDESAPANLVVIDPGDSPLQLDALARFAADMGGQVVALIFTGDPGSHPALERFPAATVVAPQNLGNAISLPGWEIESLSPGKLGVYSKKARLLFCGELLTAAAIPDLMLGADNYLLALEKAEALNAVLVVPKSGPVAQGKKAIRERITADREYTQNLVRHVLTSIAARFPRERVLSVARDVYEDYPYLEAHLRNLEAAWGEFSR